MPAQHVHTCPDAPAWNPPGHFALFLYSNYFLHISRAIFDAPGRVLPVIFSQRQALRSNEQAKTEMVSAVHEIIIYI